MSFVKQLRNHWLQKANSLSIALEKEKDPIKRASIYAALRVLKFCKFLKTG